LSSIGAALSSTNLEISIAVANVVAMMQTHKLNNPRSVMVFVGIISSITFAFLFYWYITTFIEKIWNRFFVQAYDKPLFWLWLGLQVILLIIIFFKPSWWWIFPLSSYFVILLITGHRLRRLKRTIEGIRNFHINVSDDLVLEEKGENEEVNAIYTTQLRLISSIYRNSMLKGLCFGGQFIFVMWVAQIARASFPIETQMLFVGLYAAAAGLFVSLSFFAFLLRIFSGMPRLRERAEKNDYDYFSVIVR
jgi:hypothetical protein